MIAIRGIGSTIAQSLLGIITDVPSIIERNEKPPYDIPYNADRYFFCQGLLLGKKRIDQDWNETLQTHEINYVQVACMCDSILEWNNEARICVMGSESGIVGSYDEVYADSKRLLHHYVETKRLEPKQQLVCIAPSIIEDTDMTRRRLDVDNLSRLRNTHPKRRFVTSMEVAKLVKFLLYDDLGYISNVVIRMNGGGHLR